MHTLPASNYRHAAPLLKKHLRTSYAFASGSYDFAKLFRYFTSVATFQRVLTQGINYRVQYNPPYKLLAMKEQERARVTSKSWLNS